MGHDTHWKTDLMGRPRGVWETSSVLYQSRADAAGADAANAETDGQRQRHEESRKNWQRLADQARWLEDRKARSLAGDPDE